MRNIILCIGVFVVLSCKAQQNSLPLNTWMENTPNNAHLKDLGNELATYIGIYKANYKGKEMKLLYLLQKKKIN